MFERPHIKRAIFTDTMAGRYESLDSNLYVQVFANDYFFASAYPMDKKSLVEQGLRDFIVDLGFMDCLVCDTSKEQTSKGTDFMKEVRKHRIYLHVTHPDCHNKSNVEGVIREMRKKGFRVIMRKKASHRLWNHGLK